MRCVNSTDMIFREPGTGQGRNRTAARHQCCRHPTVAGIEALSLHAVVDKQHADDRFARDWQSFDAVQAGTLIGHRASGAAVHAPGDGWLV